MSLNVLVTMVGAQTSPGILRAIKRNDEREIYLVGVDPVRLVPGAYFVDKFYQVTPSFEDESKYIEELLRISKEEAIDIILPCGNEDCIAMSKNMDLFIENDVVVVSSNYCTLQNAFDKYIAYNIISRITPEYAPAYHLVKNIDDFIKYSELLGYPDKKIVIKPRYGRGGRGVYTLDPSINVNALMTEKPSGTLPFEVFKYLLNNTSLEHFPEFIVMEYLPGDVYSVYSLCDHGKSLITIPQRRIWGTASNTLIGEITPNEEYIRPSEKLCESFGFMYNVNMEMKISDTGIPKIFDINPRIAASTAIFRAIDYNLPYLSIKMALGESFYLPPLKEGVVMLRYLNELFYNQKDGIYYEI